MQGGSGSTFGGFLEDLPKALYVLAHVVFFGLFANWITLKMAVLVEQTLMLVMVCMIAISAF